MSRDFASFRAQSLILRSNLESGPPSRSHAGFPRQGRSIATPPSSAPAETGQRTTGLGLFEASCCTKTQTLLQPFLQARHLFWIGISAPACACACTRVFHIDSKCCVTVLRKPARRSFLVFLASTRKTQSSKPNLEITHCLSGTQTGGPESSSWRIRPPQGNLRPREEAVW